MFFEDKLEEIEAIVSQIKDEERVLIWGMGRHTDELLKHTRLPQHHDLMFTSKDGINGLYFGRSAVCIEKLDFERIDCIVISSCKFQDEIEQMIITTGFRKKVIKLYKTSMEGEFFRLPHRGVKEGFYVQGNYKTWNEAKKDARGYEDPAILEKVYHAVKKVMDGNAAYERDSAVFYKTAYTYHLMTLIGVLCSQKDVINIVDVGGALGSLYWQNRDILNEYTGKRFVWKVVEQSNYVQCGRANIQNDILSFWEDIEEIGSADIIIFSGVLQYVENYAEMLRKAVNLRPKYILVDRTFVSGEGRIAVEYVGDGICKGSYPVRIFEVTEIRSLLEGYCLKVDFPSYSDREFYIGSQRVEVKCMVFELETWI